MLEINKMNSNDNGLIKGTCLLMCPTKERILRIREELIHPLECKVKFKGGRTKFPDHQRMVKEFARSAAGNVISPSQVRPLPILQQTVHYLLSDICLCDDVNWKDIYYFVANRLRAIRQDITVQGLGCLKVAKLYHSVSRFYVYAEYNMCEYDEKHFDSYLNMKHLSEIISIIINIYKENSFQLGDSILDKDIGYISPKYQTSFNSEDEMMSSLENMFANVDLDSKMNKSLFSDDQDMQFNQSVLIDENKQYRMEEIFAINMLVNLGKREVLRDTMDLPKRLRQGTLLCSVITASIWWLNGNFLPLSRLIVTLPPILCCALHTNLNHVQRQVLGAFSVSYNNTNFFDVSESLSKNLLFSSAEKLIQTCSYYGIDSSDDGIKFKKSSFKWNTIPMKQEKCDWLNDKLKECSLSSLFF